MDCTQNDKTSQSDRYVHRDCAGTAPTCAPRLVHILCRDSSTSAPGLAHICAGTVPTSAPGLGSHRGFTACADPAASTSRGLAATAEAHRAARRRVGAACNRRRCMRPFRGLLATDGVACVRSEGRLPNRPRAPREWAAAAGRPLHWCAVRVVDCVRCPTNGSHVCGIGSWSFPRRMPKATCKRSERCGVLSSLLLLRVRVRGSVRMCTRARAHERACIRACARAACLVRLHPIERHASGQQLPHAHAVRPHVRLPDAHESAPRLLTRQGRPRDEKGRGMATRSAPGAGRTFPE